MQSLEEGSDSSQDDSSFAWCHDGGDNHGKFNGFTALGKTIGTRKSTLRDSEYVELARHLDETGLHRVRTGVDQTWSGLVGLYHSNRPVLVWPKYVHSLTQVCMVCAKFAQCLATNEGFFWEKNPVGKRTNLHQTLNKPDRF